MISRIIVASMILLLSCAGLFLEGEALAEDINGVHGKYTGENNDMIDMYTGTLNIYQNDLTLPGINGLDVVIGRTYSSDIAYDDITPDSTSPHWGGLKPFEYFGCGWHWSMPRIYNDTIYYGDGSSEALFSDYPADYLGRKKTRQYSLIFAYSDSAACDSLFSLDGTKMIFGPRYHFNNGSDLVYAGKYVRKVTSPHGDSISFIYWKHYPFIKKIRDSIGREIWFEYSADSAAFGLSTRLSKIKYLNWHGDTISVNYYYSGDYLVKAKYPSGDSILYSYNSGRLAQIVEPYGGRISYNWGDWPQWRYRITQMVWHPDTTVYDDCEIGSPDWYFCHQYYETCPCTSITAGYDTVTTNYFNWQRNVQSRKRVYLNDAADSILFDYGYPSEYCSGSVTYVDFPDSSEQVFFHAGYKNPEQYYYCSYNGGENILYEVITYENRMDTLFERLWFVGDAPNGPSDENVNTVRIGTAPNGDSVTVPAVRISGVYYNGNYINNEASTYSTFDSFDPHTGIFAVTCNNGVSVSTVGHWDTTGNRYFPTYRQTCDSTGSYIECKTVQLFWNYQLSNLDSAKAIYGNDVLTTSFTYDSHGNKISTTDPQGNTIYYDYSSNYGKAFLTRMYSTSPSVDFSFTRYYFYSGAESIQVSPNLDTTRYSYDSANRLIEIKRPLETASWSYKKQYLDNWRQLNEYTKLNAQDSSTAMSNFNEFNWPIRTAALENSDWLYSDIRYDNMGRISRMTRPYKNAADTCWTKIFYDGLGRTIKTLYPDGTRDSVIYTALTTETVDKLGRRKKTVLDDHFRLQKAFSDSAFADSITYLYGPWGKVVRETDARGLIKKYWYDKYGRLYSDSSDDGRRFYYYDKGNNLRLSRESATDTVWKYIKYDGLGRQLELGTVIRPDTTQVNNSSYPSNGTVLATYKYDDYSTGFKPLADSAHYNSKMNLTEITDQSGKTWLYYDNRNRLWRKKQYIGGLADTVDIYYSYDSADRLSSITYPDSSVVDYNYYRNGWLKSIPNIVDNGKKNGISYTPWGSVKSMIFFNDTSYTDNFTYDTLTTRLTKIYSRKGNTKFWGQTYEYDSPGNITKNFGLNSSGAPVYTDTMGIHVYNYNYLLKQSRVKSTSVAKSLQYAYDDNGNRLSESIEGVTTNYYYEPDTSYHFQQTLCSVAAMCSDIGNEVDSAAFTPASYDTIHWECTFAYSGSGSFKIGSTDGHTYVPTRTSSGSGTFVPQTLAAIYLRAQCTQLHKSVSGIAFYEGDSSGTPNSNKIDHLSGQDHNNYHYDNAGRLIGDVAADKEYIYNPLGQLVKYKKDGNERSFFTYDYSGHLVKKMVLQGNLCDHPDTCSSALDLCDTINVSLCAYKPGDVNNNGQLNGIDAVFLNAWLTGIGPAPAPPLSRSDANCSGSVNGIDVTYIVSYLQGRVSQPSCCYWNCSTFVSIYYIYSGDQVIAEYNNTGGLEWNYVYGLGQRVAKYKGSEKWAFHNDHLGNVRAVTNVSGSTVNKADYYPYGDRLFSSGDIGKYSYNGKEYIDDYGFDLYYYGARFMDPNTGRFITPDPIEDYLNQYSYVGNNPVNRIDPTGMLARPFVRLTGLTSHGFNFPPSENPDTYFDDDHRTKIEKLTDAIAQAKEYEQNMAKNGPEEDREVHRKNAQWLEYLLLSGNYGIDESIIAVESAAEMTPILDARGKIIGGQVLFGLSAVNEADEILVGTVIHEISHFTFTEKHGRPPDRDTDYEGFWTYKYKTEHFALEYEYDYYTRNDNAVKGLSKDVDNWLRNTSGMKRSDAVDWYMKNSYYYKYLYWMFGPGKGRW